MAQRQLRPATPESEAAEEEGEGKQPPSSPPAAIATSKPTASVLPVVKQRSDDVMEDEDESPMDIDNDDSDEVTCSDVTCSNKQNTSQLTLDTSSSELSDSQQQLTSISSNNNKLENFESFSNSKRFPSEDVSNSPTLLNGGVPHLSDALQNGGASKPNGPISLLSGGVSPTNVYTSASELLKPSDLFSTGKSANTDSLLGNRGRNAESASNHHGNKNIVLGTLNRHTGVITTKVVTATTHTGKVRTVLRRVGFEYFRSLGEGLVEEQEGTQNVLTVDQPPTPGKNVESFESSLQLSLDTLKTTMIDGPIQVLGKVF